MTEVNTKRITFKRTRPNPLFQSWLEELHGEACLKKSKLEPMLKEALTSLSKYPLPLLTGTECAILSGFDKRLCQFLDNRLEVYKNNKHSKVSPKRKTVSSTEPFTAESSSSNHINAHEAKSTRNHVVNTRVAYETEPSTTGSFCSNDIISAPKAPSTHNNGVNIKVPHSTEPSTAGGSCSNHINAQLESTSTNNGINIDLCNTEPSTSGSSYSNHVNSPPEATNTLNNGFNKKTSKRKQYKPAHRSGGYAILLGLLECTKSDKTPINKDSLIEISQKYSEESFVRPKPESFYTAWSNMNKLITKGLVKKEGGRKALYSLTEQGILLANELLDETKNTPSVNNQIFNNGNDIVAPSGSQERGEPVLIDRESNDNLNEGIKSSTKHQNNESAIHEMSVGSFDVILLIDKNETSGLSKKNDPTVAQFQKYPDLKHEYRSLKVGDFTWIARHKVDKTELVLPYIIERKRMDDLGASIKDGRFHEQKFRLRRCGLENVIYMVENYGGNKHVGLPVMSLMQALANTRVQDGFKVHMTESLTHSVRFLAMMTKRLAVKYRNKSLKGRNQEPVDDILMTFEYFNKASVKNRPLTVTDTFIKLLLQLKGVSVEKALAITKMYKTPSSLFKAYEGCSKKEGELLLANLKLTDASRNVGPCASKTIYQLFTVVQL